MLGDIVSHARQQAERSSAAVRAPARMRIARVQSVADPGQARITFDMALDEIRSFPSREREFFLEHAQQIAAAFAPDLVREIAFDSRFPNDCESERLVEIMLQHGHIDAAFDYVIQCDVPFSFPFGYAGNLMQKLDDQRRITLLRRASDAWRAAQDHELMRKQAILKEGQRLRVRRGPNFQLGFGFIHIFQSHWEILPSHESLTVVREIVRIAMQEPDKELTSAGYGQEVQFTSGRAYVLFEVLHILRHLDPPLAESLIANHEQLAVAVRRFPNGIETIRQEGEERRKQLVASGAACEGGFILAGNPPDFPYQMALRQSAQGGDFRPPIDHALERYREDTAPDSSNQAPKTFWPSIVPSATFSMEPENDWGREPRFFSKASRITTYASSPRSSLPLPSPACPNSLKPSASSAARPRCKALRCALALYEICPGPEHGSGGGCRTARKVAFSVDSRSPEGIGRASYSKSRFAELSRRCGRPRGHTAEQQTPQSPTHLAAIWRPPGCSWTFHLSRGCSKLTYNS
jgi:hypothetical protein